MTTSQAAYAMRTRNPDVLSCIANLSNDEIFTPPEIANEMLDALALQWANVNQGANIWAEPAITFLDPFTKTGVFLREITKRLVNGLAHAIPDLETRVDHVLTKQVFGLGITQITSLLARRSLYCSKDAMGEHSVAKSFQKPHGNIWFERTEHTWVGGTSWVYGADEDGQETKYFTNGRCKFCGAPQLLFDRDTGLEAHSSAFIHTDDPRAQFIKWFGRDMHFDVVIGNPPYQMTGGGGGTNDSSIYQLFVRQAMTLEPRFLSMVIPSRWMSGGRGPGLAEFRADFLRDRRIRALVDFENAKDAFPTVGIGGGVCYFLWDRDNPGLCQTEFRRGGAVIGPVERRLDQFETFVRDPRAVSILEKVMSFSETKFESLVSGDTPFGLATNFASFREGVLPVEGELLLYANKGTKRVTGSVSRDTIRKNTHLIDSWKLFLPVAGSGRERERTGVDLVLGPSLRGEPGSVCTQTYLVAGPLEGSSEAESVESYLRTRLARFIISLRKPAQHVFRGMYRWLPIQSWDRLWTDEALYEKYGITDDEQAYINSFIKPIDGEKVRLVEVS